MRTVFLNHLEEELSTLQRTDFATLHLQIHGNFIYLAETQMKQVTAEIHQINMFNNHQNTKILSKPKMVYKVIIKCGSSIAVKYFLNAKMALKLFFMIKHEGQNQLSDYKCRNIYQQHFWQPLYAGSRSFNPPFPLGTTHFNKRERVSDSS